MASNDDTNQNRRFLNAYVPQTSTFNNEEGGFEVGDITNINLQKTSPIGLNFRMSASLINKIKSTLNEHYKENGQSSSPQLHTKSKASNMAAIYLKIGSWQWVSENEGDLAVKFYYGKKKLVWEFLYGCRKKKIEIRWSQISAINAFVEEGNKGRLEIELNDPPEFCKEINFQPKKHTQWAATKDDFTNGQALSCRRHTVVFPAKALDEPFKKLLQCDSRLFSLSQQPFPTHNYPLFQKKIIDFSCNKCDNGCSSSPVPNHVQRDGSSVGLPSYSNLQTHVLKSPDWDEKATTISYERTRTNGVWEQNGNKQVQEISVTPFVNQDDFRQNKDMESWSPSQLPEYTNGSTPFNQSYQMNYMTGGHTVDQSYVNNGIVLTGPNPWSPVETRVGFDNFGSGSSSGQVMNQLTYVDDGPFINAGYAFHEPTSWFPVADYSLNEFINGGNGDSNALNEIGYADNGIQGRDLSGGNSGDVLFDNSISTSKSTSKTNSNLS